MSGVVDEAAINPREKALIDLFAAMEGLAGSAYECKYYPCHFEGQDCSLCYCPFYPCLIYRLGGELIISSTGNYIWSCKNCKWIHEKENVEEILTYFSGYPRQYLVEADWRFFSRSLQEILFGEEVGIDIGSAYNLMPANFYGYQCEPTNSGEFLDIILDGFRIVSVKKRDNADEGEGVLIPEKSGKIMVGMVEGGFVRCML